MPSGNGSKPATQADLQAVKSDLQTEIRTVKSELQVEIQAVKTELKKDFKRVAVEVVKTNAAMARMEDSLRAEMSANTNRIITVLDESVKRTGAANRAAVLHGQMLSKHAETLDDHDKRLLRLEAGP